MEDKSLHDWTLKTIELDWGGGTVKLGMSSSPGVIEYLTAQDLVELVVPRLQEWGPSESIMSSEGPLPDGNNNQRLKILMQSGDSLVIVARDIVMPGPGVRISC